MNQTDLETKLPEAKDVLFLVTQETFVFFKGSFIFQG